MKAREIFGSESAFAARRERERVPDGEHRRGAGTWRQFERVRLVDPPDFKRDVRGAAKRAFGGRNNRDNRHAARGDRREYPLDLFRLAAVRKRQKNVVRTYGSQIAVIRFARMKKMARNTDRRRRRGNLAADETRLPHARNDEGTAEFDDERERVEKARVEPIDLRENRRALRFKNAFGEIQRVAFACVRFGQNGSERERAVDEAAASNGRARGFARYFRNP